MPGGAHNTKLTVAIAAIAVTAVMIWLSGDGNMPEPFASVPERAVAAAPAAAPTSPPPGEPSAAEDRVAPPDQGPADPAEEFDPAEDVEDVEDADAGAEDLERELARLIYRRVGPPMVNVLIGNGMAPSDGEEIVRRATDDIAACVIDALRTEAASGTVSLDTLLLALEAVMRETDIPEAEEILRTGTIAANAEACTYAVGQQAGLPIG